MSESKQLFAKELVAIDPSLNYKMLFPRTKGNNLCTYKSISITSEHKTCTYVLRTSSLPVVVHVTPEEEDRKTLGHVERNPPSKGGNGMKYFNMCVSSSKFGTTILSNRNIPDIKITTVALLAQSRSAAEETCKKYLEQDGHKDIKIMHTASKSHEGWSTENEYTKQRVLGAVTMNRNNYKELSPYYDGEKHPFTFTPEPRAPKTATPGKAKAKKPRKDYKDMNRTSQRKMWKSLFRRYVMNAQRIDTASEENSADKKARNKESVQKAMKDTAKMKRWIIIMMYKMLYDTSNTDKRNVYYDKFAQFGNANYAKASAEFERVMVPRLTASGGIIVPKPKKQVKVKGLSDAPPKKGATTTDAEFATDVEERYRV